MFADKGPTLRTHDDRPNGLDGDSRGVQLTIDILISVSEPSLITRFLFRPAADHSVPHMADFIAAKPGPVDDAQFLTWHPLRDFRRRLGNVGLAIAVDFVWHI